MDDGPLATDTTIAAVLTDVDGTLVTRNKVLTERALSAVRTLNERGVIFTITSGRPPFGMRMLVEPLGLALPMAAFNGGVTVLPDLSVLDERLLPEYLLPALIDMILSHGLDVWIFRSTDWGVRSIDAPRVSRETSNIQQRPVVLRSFDEMSTGVVKIVGVSEDHPRVAACETAMQQAFGTQVSAARSQPHYLDVTHPTANKGVVVERLSRYLKIPLQRIATLGDQPNDVLMFERSGLSIAMGNASDEVKLRASFTTTSFEEEGFANAVEELILPRAGRAGGPAVRPTGRLHNLGQSLWLDNVTRELLSSGRLEHYIRDLSVTGLTSNPTIFEQAVTGSSDYDATIAELARRGKGAEASFFELAIRDLGEAADLLRPIHERTGGVDGWVSLEVSPLLADDAEGTLHAARALFEQAARRNVMIKIPGTPASLPAIEEAIFSGIPVNVTLLFSREHYLAAAEAFLRGIERRIEAGLAPDVSSVASVFVGRWDGAVAGRVGPELRSQLGIAMARRTYRAYRSVLQSPRWQRIYNAGARPQRLLWASTKPKDPALRPTFYVDHLTAQFTVVTLPEETLEGFAEHGRITTLLRADGGTCEGTIAAFARAGVDLYALASRLQAEGTAAFVGSWNALLEAITAKASPISERERPTARPVRATRRAASG